MNHPLTKIETLLTETEQDDVADFALHSLRAAQRRLADARILGGYELDVSLSSIHRFLIKWKQKQTSVVIDAAAELRKEQTASLTELTGTTRELLDRELHLAILQGSLPLPVSVKLYVMLNKETSPRKKSVLRPAHGSPEQPGKCTGLDPQVTIPYDSEISLFAGIAPNFSTSTAPNPPIAPSPSEQAIPS